MDRCRRCGKPIWVDESVKRGYGPVCWAKIKRGEIEESLWEGSESNPKNRPKKEAEV